MIIENGRTLHLAGKNISYVLFIGEYGDLLHYHFGGKIADRDYSHYKPWYAGINAYGLKSEGEVALEHIMQEYPAYGYCDLRVPAYMVVNGDENAVSRLKYKSRRIYDGKYQVEGMPSLFAGDKSVQTLEVTLCDEVAGFEAVLYYGVYDEYDIITRSVRLTAAKEIDVTRIMSTCLDLPKGDYDAVAFTGIWSREREMKRSHLESGTMLDISNARGGSGHHKNPFVMVCDETADETHGDVYAFSLIYSGDHATYVSSDVMGKLRIVSGINPLNFSWKLNAGESIMAPECVMSYSANGFEHITHTYHDVYRENLCRSKWADMDRPVLINNWEGTYFDFNEEKLLSIASAAADVGCELFVLDDGWFGKRNSDNCSLGDWYVNTEKLPCGIDGLAKKVNDLGMKFGLWFEPEMVSPDSDLFRAHPDWAIQVPDREFILGRHQLILDLAKDEVCDYIIESVSKILSTANISYVKWDMNRNMTDRPCLGYSHKYMLGFYKILDGICGAFPDVLFEGCSAGGGRFDPGVLAYMPQIWTSDNSESVSRMKIQYSTSFAYPVSAISAHVTAVPNHQNGRVSTLKMRGDVAVTGSFGYELDITKMTAEELEEIKAQIKRYKSLRTLMRTGDFYRLQNPYASEFCAWEMVSRDKSEAFLFAGRRIFTNAQIEPRVKMRGLLADCEYENVETGKRYYGSELMNVGFEFHYEPHDFASETVVLKKV